MYLCLDQGGGSSRALAIDGRGRLVAGARVAVDTLHPAPDRVEHRPEQLLAGLRRAAADCAAALPQGGRELVAAGLVTQRASCLCWRRSDGEPLTPVLSWQDRRAAAQLADIVNDRAAWQRRTGLVPSPYLGFSKLRWCLDEIPAVSGAGDDLAMGPLAAWLLQSLLAQAPFTVDPANAGRTGLCHLDGDWDDTLLQRAGLRRRWLPAVGPSVRQFGTMALANRALPLRLLNGDQSAAVFAYGAPRVDTAYVNLGTGAFVYRLLEQASGDTPLQCSLTLAAERDWWVLEGTVHGAGAALAPWSEQLGDGFGAQLDAALAAGPGDWLYLNTVGGLGSPDWRSDLEPEFVGEGAPAQQLAAVAESILFLLQRNLELLAAHGPPLRQLVASGGIAASDPLCQRLAELSGLPVLRPPESEASALGAACCLAGLPDDWPGLEAARRFEPRAAESLRGRYQRWTQLLEARMAAP